MYTVCLRHVLLMAILNSIEGKVKLISLVALGIS